MSQVLAIPALDVLTEPLSWDEKLAYLVWQFSRAEQLECPISHRFEEGRYIREIDIPAGTLLIGRPHRHGHLCELLEGEVIHVTETERVRRLAPYSIQTTPGYQMVLYALTDCRGRTTHETTTTDLAALDEECALPLEPLLELGADIHKRLAPPAQRLS